MKGAQRATTETSLMENVEDIPASGNIIFYVGDWCSWQGETAQPTESFPGEKEASKAGSRPQDPGHICPG